MSATIVSKTFDTQGGLVVACVQDDFGHRSLHTVYVMNVDDVNSELGKVLATVDENSAAIRAKMVAAGWQA